LYACFGGQNRVRGDSAWFLFPRRTLGSLERLICLKVNMKGGRIMKSVVRKDDHAMAHQSVKADATMSTSPALLLSALEAAANAIFITDQAGHILWLNPAFSHLCGYSPAELLGKTPAILSSGMQSRAFYAELWQTILAGNAWRGTVIDRKKDGSLYTADETITPLVTGEGEITNFIAIQEDITLRGGDYERDRYLAYHDLLTGLPNRASFERLVKLAIEGVAMRPNELLGLMFLDLDKFKPVNDLFGHETGDLLLQAVAERIRASVRKSDTVARFGGDEFAILLQGMRNPEIAAALAAKLVNAISQPFVIADHRLEIGLSVGVAIHPFDGKTAEELTRKADGAMYQAKREGGNAWRFCDGIPS
jgi:diguanylate cyclase (GGDEF)-like protein/PAS domain S-box-containing protein